MFVDSHAHLDCTAFDADRDAMLARAQRQGVSQIVVPATNRASWRGIRRLCADQAGVFPAYGSHPLFLHDDAPVDVEALSSWLVAGDAVATGRLSRSTGDTGWPSRNRCPPAATTQSPDFTPASTGTSVSP